MGLLDSLFGAPGSEQQEAVTSLLSQWAGTGNFGQGLLAAGQVYSPERKQKNLLFQMQMQRAQQEQEQEARKRAFLENLPDPSFAAGAQSMAGGGGPSMANAANVQVNPMQSMLYQGVKAGAVPLGDYLKTMQPKELKFGAVDPKDYTPESLRAAAQSGDYTKLVPVRKMDVVNGQAVNLYGTAPGTVFDNIDPNKPFNLRGGQAVPNQAFQRYELGKAQAGAARNQANVYNVAETEWSKKRAGDFAELMAGINKTSFAAPTQVRKLERMEQLLQGVDGGKLAPTGVEIASAANALGIKMDPRLGNKEAAQALSREIAGGFRQPGTGPMTDKDFENFLLQVPDLSKTAEGRKQITATMKAAAARDIEVGNRARAYVKKNGKLDDNFIEEISLFVAENPVVKLPKTWKVNR